MTPCPKHPDAPRTSRRECAACYREWRHAYRTRRPQVKRVNDAAYRERHRETLAAKERARRAARWVACPCGRPLVGVSETDGHTTAPLFCSQACRRTLQEDWRRRMVAGVTRGLL